MDSSGHQAVGFIGLGIMGEGMALNLLKAGRSLVVWNRSRSKCDALAAAAAGKVVVCDTPAEVLGKCSVLYCMLSTPEAVQSVYEMEGGILAGVVPGKCIIDCATIAADDMQRLAQQVSGKGGRFLEAPVSGSKGPAHAGQLIFLCAGDEALFQEAQADLDVMGKASFFFGAPGSGARMKLVVNMTMGSMMVALGEGLSLCERAQLDCKQLLQVLDLGAMANPMFKLKGPKMLAGEFEPNFPLQHQQKDLRLAVELGQSLALPLPLATTADAVMKQARDEGHSELDMCAVFSTQSKQKSGP
mmetsp:Transcript_7010/g.16381  ORF Transcript_7010/g.16381 Transcript_7010/m.16381 type:complete len:301 (-) Transcript_7010:240-1142(-)